MHKVQRGRKCRNCELCCCSLVGLYHKLSQLIRHRESMHSSSNKHELVNNSDGPCASRTSAQAVPICADNRVVSEEREHLRERLDIVEHKLDFMLATLTSERLNNQSPIGAEQQWPRKPSVPIQNSHPRLNHYLDSRF